MALDGQTRSQSLSPSAGSHEREATRPGDDNTARGSDARPQLSDDDLVPGTCIGRYMILSRVGSGAMGVVFAAFDPELDRKVAIKLLHSRGGASADNRARLVREAKALARLSHPNVVAVHEYGTFNDRVYLAMEFVAGLTLNTWMKAQPRRWQDVVAVLTRAGEGLAAAHDAGLVHRDFKPDNVLIADDGRVRVLDFGLARAASDAPDAPGAVDPTTLALLSASSSRRTPDHALEQALQTRTGALVGTPAYMSPEQHLGHGADPRSDQFAFCVALYQALYGVRPFTSPKLSALAFQIIQGKVEPAPPGAKVPTWLRKILLRGLAVDPAARFPSMRALLTALNRERARAGTVVFAGLGGLGLGLGMWMTLGSGAVEPPCLGGAARLVGVWDEARSATVEKAFLATGLPYAKHSWDSIRAALDAYSHAWVGAYNEACAATEIRHEQSDDLLDRRVRCLERHRGRLSALVEVLAQPNADTLEHVPEAISNLGDVATCADKDALLALVPPPDDPERVQAIQTQIATANALELTGDLTAAMDLSAAAANAAAEIGYAPLHADALLVRARVQQRVDALDAAGSSLGDAVVAAARGRDDHLAAEAWVDLLFHVGAHQADRGRLAAYRDAAEAAVLRVGDEPQLRARLDHASATGLERLGRADEALAPALRAVEVLTLDPDRDPARVHQALCTLALIYQDLGRFEDARDTFRRALVAAEHVSGGDHPSVANLLGNMAELILEAQGFAGEPYDEAEISQAEAFARRALEVRRKILPRAPLELALSAQTLAHVADARDDRESAEANYLEALKIYREHPEADPSRLASLYNDLAILAVRQDRLDQARDMFTKASQLMRGRFGEDHPHTRRADGNIALLSRWLGEPERALTIQEHLLEQAQREDPRSVTTAEALSEIGQTLLALGRVEEARTRLEAACKIFDAPAEGDTPDLVVASIARVSLARVLKAAGVERPRQLALLHSAEPFLTGAARRLPEARRALADLAAVRGPA